MPYYHIFGGLLHFPDLVSLSLSKFRIFFSSVSAAAPLPMVITLRLLFSSTTCCFPPHHAISICSLTFSLFAPAFPPPCLGAVTLLRLQEQITNGGRSGCNTTIPSHESVSRRSVCQRFLLRRTVATHPRRCVRLEEDCRDCRCKETWLLGMQFAVGLKD